MGIQTYPVLERLLLDGTLYDPDETSGATVDLDDTVAASLPDGVLGKPAKKPKDPPAK